MFNIVNLITEYSHPGVGRIWESQTQILTKTLYIYIPMDPEKVNPPNHTPAILQKVRLDPYKVVPQSCLLVYKPHLPVRDIYIYLPYSPALGGLINPSNYSYKCHKP